MKRTTTSPAKSRKTLAIHFAKHISKAITSSDAMCKSVCSSVFEEHKVSADFICAELDSFLRKQSGHGRRAIHHFDFEGNGKRIGEEQRSYPVLGVWTFPDAAILKPFRCAFEFDRELKSKSSGFKSILMKAAVHVLSGAYDSCVVVYVLKEGVPPFDYIRDGSKQTRQLIRLLQEQGLFLSFVHLPGKKELP